ncbi:MAG TPA: hypothetical protein VII82_04585 [Polyangiaceae bacterium]
MRICFIERRIYSRSAFASASRVLLACAALRFGAWRWACFAGSCYTGESILEGNFMRRVLFAVALALGTTSCSSLVPTGTPKPKADGGTSAPTAFQASGTISGALTGTVTNLAGYAEANVSGEDPFAVTFKGTLGQDVTVTSPDPSSLSNFAFGCTLGFSSVPSSGTFTQGTAGGKAYDCLISYSAQGATSATQFGAGTNVMSTKDALSIDITSIDKTDSIAGIDYYTLHGSLDIVFVAADGSGTTVTAPLTF